MRTNVVAAIFTRNLASYFSSPIGYVFICAFVLLSAFAAFWPNEFFNANLANLDQLNERLPWIMLVFIPAITMSLWADERRQGTDEIILTMPATDVAVVLGKYLAALTIFTIALAFSLSNVVVLVGLGAPDLGLLAANYLGYWLVGAAMLSVGMVASFLTTNLTVGFVLAVAFNAPLVFASSADAIVPGDRLARAVESLGIAAQFDDLARGVVPLSSVVYFASIVLVMLYVSMVLIGRRHWSVKTEAIPMTAHYALRVLALVAIAVGANVLATRFDVRVDATVERLTSLSPETRALLAQLPDERPVYVEAYVSPEVPEAYVQPRLNLLSTLREVDALAGDAVRVRITETDRFGPKAAEAQEQFGITAQQVQSVSGGRFSVDEIVLGVAFTCGLDKVVVPFVDRGVPVEYEIVRSITTVARPERLRVGVLSTDAQLYGGLDFQTMRTRANEAIVDELEKQYDVVQVSADAPITERYDALVAVQPSSLTPPQMEHFVAAVRSGQPTAIFEDPFPYVAAGVPATSQPKRPPGGGNPFMQQPPPPPKGDLELLWTVLQARVPGDLVVWDEYNPYPKITEFPPEFVFVGAGSGAAAPYARDVPATAGLERLLFTFPGYVQPFLQTSLDVEPLVRTGPDSGDVAYEEILRRTLFSAELNASRRLRPTGESYVLAARITGEIPSMTDADDESAPAMDEIDVVLVSDIDVLYSVFFALRNRGDQPDSPVHFDLDNVTFALNLVDMLTGDDRYVPIRSRRPKHRTLTAVERRTEAARAEAVAQRESFIQAFEAQRETAEAKLNEEVEKLRRDPTIDEQQRTIQVATLMQVGQQRLDARIEALERERDRELERIERELALETRKVQNAYKIAAVSLPPIPPLLVALVVYGRRRRLERVGVPSSRLRGVQPAGAPS